MQYFLEWFESRLHEDVAAITPRQSIGALKLMLGKYPLEHWFSNGRVNLSDKHVLMHAWYSLKNGAGINITPNAPHSQAVISDGLQRAVEAAQLQPYPQQNVLDISYNQSGLYEYQYAREEPKPNETAKYRVVKKGWAGIEDGHLKPIKQAVVTRI